METLDPNLTETKFLQATTELEESGFSAPGIRRALEFVVDYAQRELPTPRRDVTEKDKTLAFKITLATLSRFMHPQTRHLFAQAAIDQLQTFPNWPHETPEETAVNENRGRLLEAVISRLPAEPPEEVRLFNELEQRKYAELADRLGQNDRRFHSIDEMLMALKENKQAIGRKLLIKKDSLQRQLHSGTYTLPSAVPRTLAWIDTLAPEVAERERRVLDDSIFAHAWTQIAQRDFRPQDGFEALRYIYEYASSAEAAEEMWQASDHLMYTTLWSDSLAETISCTEYASSRSVIADMRSGLDFDVLKQAKADYDEGRSQEAVDCVSSYASDPVIAKQMLRALIVEE